MDKLTTRERKFIIGGALFLASAVLFFYKYKAHMVREGGIVLPSIFLAVGVFALLFPWVNFKIKKRIFLKLAIFLFLLRIASFGLLFWKFGFIVLSFFAIWTLFVIFDYVRSLNKVAYLKVIYFILLSIASYVYFYFVPIIVWGLLFGFD